MKIDNQDISFEKIMQDYYNMVHRFAYNRLACHFDADDVCQNVFISLHKYDKPFNSVKHCQAWLLRVAHNYCRKLWKSRWNRYVVCVENLDIYESRSPAEGELEYALRDISPKERSLIRNYYYHGLSVRELSKILNKNESTLATNLHKTRKKLQRILIEDYKYKL
ncbi:MAG: sigma-70 family RNA polymerase sigma factor [Erysipelotrichaceae bacterium]|nr:sigma-70 family RNA polymerase sigma factor [Erysipelotrichaceae bacterium]